MQVEVVANDTGGPPKTKKETKKPRKKTKAKQQQQQQNTRQHIQIWSATKLGRLQGGNSHFFSNTKYSC